jgi:hypothetical protein
MAALQHDGRGRPAVRAGLPSAVLALLMLLATACSGASHTAAGPRPTTSPLGAAAPPSTQSPVINEPSVGGPPPPVINEPVSGVQPSSLAVANQPSLAATGGPSRLVAVTGLVLIFTGIGLLSLGRRLREAARLSS